MTVANAATSGVANTASNHSWTHTPDVAGDPRAVVVYVSQPTASENYITGVTYGGTALAQIAGSPLSKATSQAMHVSCWFLGSGIPTGATETVVASHSASGSRLCVCITVTAAADCEVYDIDTVSSDSVTNPSMTLVLDGKACLVSNGFASGVAATTGIAPATNMQNIAEADAGASCGGCYAYNPYVTSSATDVGWQQTTEDALGIATAITETADGLLLYTSPGLSVTNP